MTVDPEVAAGAG